MVLGENIGTTITANIAAAVGSVNAKRAAMSHTLFNMFGVIWALIFFKPLLALVGIIIASMGLPNPLEVVDGTASLYGISMLHTLFNVINTLILIWFVKYIVKAVEFIIKDKKSSDDDTVKLKYIHAGHLDTAELSIEQARGEVIHFAEISRRSIDTIRKAIEAKSDKEFEAARQRLVKYEEISDRIEYEIAQFLNAMPEDSISDETRAETKRMYRIIGELESLGDSGESIGRILARRNSHEKSFNEEQVASLNKMLTAVDNAYVVMIDNLKSDKVDEISERRAIDAEVEINEMRNNMREAEVLKMERGDGNYQASVYYLDTLSEIERMGDYIINVSQALAK
jgi:phosphate:Na+ symporter